jgi:hypothetical protein
MGRAKSPDRAQDSQALDQKGRSRKHASDLFVVNPAVTCGTVNAAAARNLLRISSLGGN